MNVKWCISKVPQYISYTNSSYFIKWNSELAVKGIIILHGILFHVKFCQNHTKYHAIFAQNKNDQKDEDFAIFILLGELRNLFQVIHLVPA